MSALLPALMHALVLTSISGTIIVVACLVFERKRHQWSADARHQLIANAVFTTIGILLLATAVRLLVPACGAAACGTEAATGSSSSESAFMFGAAGKFPDLARSAGFPPRRANSPDYSTVVVLVWLTGAVLAGAGVVRRRLRSQRLVRASRAITSPSLLARLDALARRDGLAPVRAAEHPAITIPCVAGAWRPTLLLPVGFESASAEDMDLVLRHELAHIHRADGRAALAGDIAAASLWFNPLVRVATARMRDLQEMAADSRVVSSGVTPSSYAQFLLTTWRRVASAPRVAARGDLAIIGDSQISTRLRSILDPRSIHAVSAGPTSRLWRVAFVLVGLAVAAAPTMARRSQDTTLPRPVALQRELLTQERLDAILRPVMINKMADRYVAGSAIAVVHDGSTVYRAGFGRREVFREIPVDVDRTIWRIGSITKVVTGVAVMQLIDRGLLDVDADVNTYLEELKVPATYPEPVRIRHLLTHTAGFDQIGLGRHAQRAENVRPLGDFLRKNLIRIRPPGQYTTYDTYAITLLGYLVEQLSGSSYEEYLQRHVFQPLEMTRSGIQVPAALAPDVAIGYGFAGSWEAERWEYMNTAPASTVNASAADMANFATMLLDGGRFKGRRVLSERSARAMLTQQFTNHPDQPGYGFTFFEDRSFGVPAFSHGGSMAGFGSFLYLVPEHRLGVFVATNQESGVIGQAAVSALVDALFPGHPPARARRERLAAAVPLARFLGRYTNSMYHHTDPTKGWRINPTELSTDAEGRLVFNGAPAYPVGPLAFQRDDGVLLSFVEDSQGNITRFIVNQSVYERLK